MLESVADAIERQDYRTAAQLLQPLVQQSPSDSWVRFYVARVHEGSGRAEKAERLYRQLLKTEINRKLITLARQGIQRIQTREQAQRQAAIAQATDTSGRTALGGLILKPLSPETRERVTPSFARMMQLEPYAAKLLLPTRGWRFYRTGKIGALQVYVRELEAIGVPAFCAALEDLATIPVFQTRQLELGHGTITAHPVSDHPLRRHATGSHAPTSPGKTLQFRAQDVRACLEGALPIFESVVDVNRLVKQQYVRKEQVQDYAKVLDLHLPKQIIRLCDQTYRYAPEALASPAAKTSPETVLDVRYVPLPQKWGRLLSELRQAGVPEVVRGDRFKQFAATALDQEDFLRRVQPQIELSNASALIFHDEAPPWHEAFHLYSTLAFTQSSVTGVDVH
ncbi:MAG: tetratricopeptide repeat protein [Synechococcales cyanobacterium RU_4_20]|nr:tetratricopeptide repeat protein [Synechococcales cyanobacterium RU_4_20]NJR69110.1 tetratricopeptide repeat protein [Synechococcales cyanobacterium CRU_2_2]